LKALDKAGVGNFYYLPIRPWKKPETG
jgi:hypothetical protein